jgi:UDP-glucuronate 4-epimerase
MKHYLVTGGAGFIGSHLIRSLFEKDPGCRVTCVDNFDPFYSADQKQIHIRSFKNHPSFRFIVNDIAETTVEELTEQTEEPVDVIIHCAAKAGVRPSIENPLAYQQTNIIGLQRLLDFAKENNIRQFVFTSSSSVYGINNHFPWKEDDKLLPVSPYAMTKLAGEMLGHVYSHLHGIRFIALRLFTVYGPGQRPDLAVHKFTKAILNGQPITLYGDGSTSRDYTYIDDIVSGIMAAILYDQSNFEIINLGNNLPVPLRELIKAIEITTGQQAILEKLPEQPGDVPKTFADISKACHLLGYQPKTELKTGLKKFYDWFLENRPILMPDE